VKYEKRSEPRVNQGDGSHGAFLALEEPVEPSPWFLFVFVLAGKLFEANNLLRL
jgi:hypothetical protein